MDHLGVEARAEHQREQPRPGGGVRAAEIDALAGRPGRWRGPAAPGSSSKPKAEAKRFSLPSGSTASGTSADSSLMTADTVPSPPAATTHRTWRSARGAARARPLARPDPTRPARAAPSGLERADQRGHARAGAAPAPIGVGRDDDHSRIPGAVRYYRRGGTMQFEVEVYRNDVGRVGGDRGGARGHGHGPHRAGGAGPDDGRPRPALQEVYIEAVKPGRIPFETARPPTSCWPRSPPATAHREAMVLGDERVTFADFLARVDAFAAGLAALGLGPRRRAGDLAAQPPALVRRPVRGRAPGHRGGGAQPALSRPRARATSSASPAPPRCSSPTTSARSTTSRPCTR